MNSQASLLFLILVTGSVVAYGKTYKSNPITISVRGPMSQQDFLERCSAPGVIKCVGFDSTADIAGGYGDNSGILAGETRPTIDFSEKASGSGSLKFSILSRSGPNGGGSYFTNFSKDLSVQFDGNAEFYIQWRQKMTSTLIRAFPSSQGGETAMKQIIIGTGDKPGCTASTSANGKCYSSCTALETVVQGYYGAGFPIMYNSCTGSASHGPYDLFEEPFNGFDFKLQNARPAPYCLYSQRSGGYYPQNGNCFGWVADEWMTFQVQIKTGPRQGNEFKNSYVKLWMAREGKPSQLVIDWGPYNLSAGPSQEEQRFGKVWLLPYMTSKDSQVNHPDAYTWYDELIISRQRIADPR